MNAQAGLRLCCSQTTKSDKLSLVHAHFLGVCGSYVETACVTNKFSNRNKWCLEKHGLCNTQASSQPDQRSGGRSLKCMYVNDMIAIWKTDTACQTSAFAIRVLQSMLYKLASHVISTLKQLYATGQPGLSMTCSETPKTGFLPT